ncbi:MAG: cyclase family protein [Candidatus Delongbacteria bacterium]|nr:cyclase family protein [Candidatus Delongbacteria bacterium]MBN2834904.1 cyclase family protein [Candidatus Delongbacteria bacterium]
MKRVIDLSHKINSEMPVYPGDLRTNLQQTKRFDIDLYNSFNLNCGMHVGTHIDGPLHMIDGKTNISEAELENFIGKAIIIDISKNLVYELNKDDLDFSDDVSIVLFRTGMSKFYGEEIYYSKSPQITGEVAEYLVKKKIKVIGFDSPSPDNYPYLIHKILFKNDIHIVENLTNLDKLEAKKEFQFIALPLKIDADSSLCRAIAMV